MRAGRFPWSVLLSTPVAVFGALVALWLRRVCARLVFLPPYMVQMENDVYTQIGLVMLIGLGAKNSILIVAFAKEEYERGRPLVEAALDGARLRFRPLMMTRARVYCRVRAAMDSVRSRRNRAPDYRYDGDRRHVGGDLHRQILCSGDLLRR